jgi:hypothetical protein
VTWREELRKSNPDDMLLTRADSQLLADPDISAQCEAAIPHPSRPETLETAERLRVQHELGLSELRILSIKEVHEADVKTKARLEKEAEEAMFDVDDLDNENVRDALRREEISALKDLKWKRDQARLRVETYPAARADAIAALAEATKLGSVKALKAAIKQARLCELQGTNTVEATLAKAVVALKVAEERRRRAESRKTLVAQRNECFIRTEPLGTDREHRRYWVFRGDHANRVWVEEDVKGAVGDSIEEGDLMSKERSEASVKANFVEYVQHTLGLGELPSFAGERVAVGLRLGLGLGGRTLALSGWASE